MNDLDPSVERARPPEVKITFLVNEPVSQAAIRAPGFHVWEGDDGQVWAEFHRVDKGILLRFHGLADFEIDRYALCVTCTPDGPVAERTIDHLYRNQVLPLVLNGLGKSVFHASAVAIGGKAVAFFGDTGMGKSTLAAGFAQRGYQILSDDCLIVDQVQSGASSVVPSASSVRLWKDSQEALKVEGWQELPGVDYTTKRRFAFLRNEATREPAYPLSAALFLRARGVERVCLKRLRNADTAVEWAKHAFLLDIEDRDLLAKHFEAITDLSRTIRCYELDYPRSYQALESVIDLVSDLVKSDD